MEWIYEWIRGLVFYLILMTMVLNLLPDKKYEKYLRLFTGMIFILLVFRPFLDMSGMEERMAGVFERITFQNDAKLLKREIEDAEQTRMSRLMDGYGQAVEVDLKTMAEGFRVICSEVKVELEKDSGSDRFGSLVSVEMEVRIPGPLGEDENTEESRNKRLEANREIVRLRRKIGEYYGLEEGKIKIRLENQ